MRLIYDFVACCHNTRYVARAVPSSAVVCNGYYLNVRESVFLKTQRCMFQHGTCGRFGLHVWSDVGRDVQSDVGRRVWSDARRRVWSDANCILVNLLTVFVMPLLIIYYMSSNTMSFVGGRRRRSSVITSQPLPSRQARAVE